MSANIDPIPHGPASLMQGLIARLSPASWTYSIPGNRDYRLDFLRGFLVLAMVVDHIGGDSPVTAFTGGNRFLVSAAEGFIFISGMLMGIVYGGRAVKLGLSAGIQSVLRRASVLYVSTVVLTLAFIGLFQFTEIPIWMERSSGLGVATPVEAVIGTLTLHYSYHATDILLVYVLLVSAAPLVIYGLVKGRTGLVLTASWVLWALYQWFPRQADLPWVVTNSVFPFAAWQVLFFTGLVLGFHRRKVAEYSRYLGHPVALALLGGAFIGMLLINQAQQANNLGLLGIPGLNNSTYDVFFGKIHLGPGRVIAFFLLAALVQQVVTRLWSPIHFGFGWLLVPLGQASLLAYGAHLFLIGPSQTVLGNYLFGESGIVAGAAQVSVLLLIWALIKAQPVPPMMFAWLQRTVSAGARTLLLDNPTNVPVRVRRSRRSRGARI